jgi:Holliday junction DNA helicase RuvA
MRFDGGVVLEAGGVGYEVCVPDNSPLYLKVGSAETVLVYTALALREDDVSLYGFPDPESLELFRKLQTVQGVGAKAALALLSALPLQELRKAILFEDVAMLTRANGIGKKTAQRIVLELKEKIGEAETGGFSESAAVRSGSARDEALDALLSLGYSRSEAMEALLPCGDDLSAEACLRQALRSMKQR